MAIGVYYSVLHTKNTYNVKMYKILINQLTKITTIFNHKFIMRPYDKNIEQTLNFKDEINNYNIILYL